MRCFDCLTEMVPHVYTVQCDVELQATVLTWLDMRIVLESGEIWAKEKNIQSLSSLRVGLSLAACVRDRAHEETGRNLSSCVRVCQSVCDLFCDVLRAGWSKKLLRAIWVFS